MNERHQEYIEYYKVRMDRYRNNPLYTNSFLSEKTLYKAILSSTTLEDFRHKIDTEKLYINNVIDLVEDRELARINHYKKMKEPVRTGASQEILRKLHEIDFENEIDISNFVSAIEQAWSKNIVRDIRGVTELKNDIDILETIEVYKSAAVVNEFRDEVNTDRPIWEKEKGRDHWSKKVLPEMKKMFPDWEIDYGDILNEERHRRKLPYPNDVVKKRIEQHKEYIGRS